jgi:pimeloyl-ACP methyl ester carboxylesterase
LTSAAAARPPPATGSPRPDLVADIERLRVHFGVELAGIGGSLGSTLALAYAGPP